MYRFNKKIVVVKLAKKTQKALNVSIKHNKKRIIVSSITAQPKPFLKWVGGKRSILSELKKRMPAQFTEYYEPFVGGGALFFAILPKNAFISDINSHLITTYTAIRDNVGSLINELKKHKYKHNKTHFLEMRKQLSLETNSTKIAGIFIYLNKTCYNGMYRVNKSGEFNVPMGNYKNPPILDEENLRAGSLILQNIKIEQKGFDDIKPKKGAFYYLDPPYHQTYSEYDGSGFGEKEHEKLADLCNTINKIGGVFMLSNSNTEFIRTLYNKYNIEEIMASRTVSCKANQRGKSDELIIKNYK